MFLWTGRDGEDYRFYSNITFMTLFAGESDWQGREGKGREEKRREGKGMRGGPDSARSNNTMRPSLPMIVIKGLGYEGWDRGYRLGQGILHR
jgi:hypothetical protein